LYVIVGVDPGTTIAIAALDLSGNFIGTWSGRDAGKERTMEQARRFGIPCIFAADVARAPETVAKLAAYANTRLYSPPRDLGQREKLELARGTPYSNSHELDAIAAAFKAYHHFENKLRLIDRAMAERGLEEKAEEVKRLAIGGLAVHQALLLFGGKGEKEEALPPARREESKRDLLSELLSLARSNPELRKAIERLERERSELGERVRELERGTAARIMRDRELRHRDRIISSLRELLSRRGRKKEKKRGARKDLKGFSDKEKPVDLEALIHRYRYD